MTFTNQIMTVSFILLISRDFIIRPTAWDSVAYYQIISTSYEMSKKKPYHQIQSPDTLYDILSLLNYISYPIHPTILSNQQ